MNSIHALEKPFAYFYINRNEPDKIKQVVPTHVLYWKTANLKGYMGSPFGDRTGGLISFIATSLEEATEVILRDPFIQNSLRREVGQRVDP